MKLLSIICLQTYSVLCSMMVALCKQHSFLASSSPVGVWERDQKAERGKRDLDLGSHCSRWNPSSNGPSTQSWRLVLAPCCFHTLTTRPTMSSRDTSQTQLSSFTDWVLPDKIRGTRHFPLACLYLRHLKTLLFPVSDSIQENMNQCDVKMIMLWQRENLKWSQKQLVFGDPWKWVEGE